MKQEEINQMSVDGIHEEIALNREKLTKLQLTHKVAPLENPMQLRTIRRTIAQLKTELTKRTNQAS